MSGSIKRPRRIEDNRDTNLKIIGEDITRMEGNRFIGLKVATGKEMK